MPETGRGRGLPVSRAEVVEVVIPALPEFVSVVRLTAATVAARQDFTYDEIEDLKIAVGEACTALIVSGNESGHPMTVRFTLGHDTLEVNLAARGNAIDLHPAAVSDRAPLDEARLGVFLMQCLVDEVEARHDRSSGTAELRLVKRRQG